MMKEWGGGGSEMERYRRERERDVEEWVRQTDWSREGRKDRGPWERGRGREGWREGGAGRRAGRAEGGRGWKAPGLPLISGTEGEKEESAPLAKTEQDEGSSLRFRFLSSVDSTTRDHKGGVQRWLDVLTRNQNPPKVHRRHASVTIKLRFHNSFSQNKSDVSKILCNWHLQVFPLNAGQIWSSEMTLWWRGRHKTFCCKSATSCLMKRVRLRRAELFCSLRVILRYWNAKHTTHRFLCSPFKSGVSMTVFC